MFDLFGGRPELSVELDRNAVAPRATVQGTLSVSSEKDRDVTGGVVCLRCDEVYKYRVRRRSGKQTRVVTATETCRLVDEQQDFTGPSVMPAGQTMTYGFCFELPEAPPTYQGDLLNVRWSVWAKLAVDDALDAIAEAPLVVYHPPEGPYPQSPVEADPERHAECDIDLTLEGTAFRLGGEVCGVLRLETRDELEAQEVRVELNRVEHVPARLGNTRSERVVIARLTSQTQLLPGVSLDLPFRLELPDELTPSVSLPHGTAYYELDAVVARSWQSDLHLCRGMHAFTLPADDAS